MAISKVGNAEAYGSGTAVSVTHGLTIQEDDVVVAIVNCHGSANTITDNNGAYAFAKDDQQTSGGNHQAAIFHRVAGASEPASYAFTLGTSNPWDVQVRVLRGVDGAAVWDVAPATSFTTDYGTTPYVLSQTMAKGGGHAIFFVAVPSYTTSASGTDNGFADELVNSGGECTLTASRAFASAGGTGDTSCSISSNKFWCAWLGVLLQGAAIIAPTGIPSTMGLGESAETFVWSAGEIYAHGISSTMGVGSPSVNPVFIEPAGIASTMAVGDPGIGFLWVSGIATTIAFGLAQVTSLPPSAVPGELPLVIRQPMELRSAADAYLGLLPLATDVRISQSMNALDRLSFDYPVKGPLFSSLIEGALVRHDGEDYRIVTVSSSRGSGALVGSIQAEQHCVNLGDTLEKTIEIENEYVGAALATILEGTGWMVGGVGITKRVSFTQSWGSPLAAIFKLADLANGEVTFDSLGKRVYVAYQRGADRGASLIYRKNVVGLDRECDAGVLFNRVYFEGKDGLTSSRGYVEDKASIAKYGRRDYYWNDPTITKISTLVYGAILRLQAFKAPRTVYRCTAYNIQPADTHWPIAELGDTVKVYDEDLGVNTTCRVFSREFAPFEPEVPDNLTLSLYRDWFPDLSEKLIETTDPTAQSNARQQKKSTSLIRGAGVWAYCRVAGADPDWQGSGKPHISTPSFEADGEGGGFPVYLDGLWYSGNDNDGDGIPDDGPIGSGGDDEDWTSCTDWTPDGVDTDGDFKEDWWPFSGIAGRHGIPGGHCTDGDEQVENWDYGGSGAAPYPAVGRITNWQDLSGYLYYGFDEAGSGAPVEYDDVANMAVPFWRTSLDDGLMLSADGETWVSAPVVNPIWHSEALAGDIYLTGWDEGGNRNNSGPIYDAAAGAWDPAPYDMNNDGKGDFWPYGLANTFGRDWDEDGNPLDGVQIPEGGISNPYILPGATFGGGAGVSTTLRIAIDETGYFVSEEWEHGFDTSEDIVQFLVTPQHYDKSEIRLSDLAVERVTDTTVRITGYAEVL